MSGVECQGADRLRAAADHAARIQADPLAFIANTGIFTQIARSDALTVSDGFQRQIDAPLLAELFPSEQPLAYFKFAPSVTEQSGRVVEDAVKLPEAGYRIDPAELSEKTGYGVTAADVHG